MNIIYQVDVSVVVVSAWNFVWMAVIVTAHLDNHQIGGLLCANVPFLGLVAICCRGARARV